jgi:LacI family transcriptional regulator
VKPSLAATIKDVARAAGVHYSTVSLALRGHPSIPARTRERVERVAQRVGYRRSEVLSALSRFRQSGGAAFPAPRIAYLVNRSPAMGFDALVHQQHFLAGARQQAEALGYELELLFVAPGHHDSSSLAEHLRVTNTTGVIVGAFEPGLGEVSLDWNAFSVVKIDSCHVAPAAPVVSNDQLHVVRLAFQKLAARGYRRIGLAVGRGDEVGTNHRHAMGYLIEQSALPAEARVPSLLFPYNASPPEVAELLGDWIRQHRVDAVLCNWLNVEDLLRDVGLRVPRDVACACLCLVDARPRLAGVVPHLRVVGAHAVSLLASLMRSGERGEPEFASCTFVPALWRDGASAPLRRKRPEAGA